jgi:hypothetical protein
MCNIQIKNKRPFLKKTKVYRMNIILHEITSSANKSQFNEYTQKYIRKFKIAINVMYKHRKHFANFTKKFNKNTTIFLSYYLIILIFFFLKIILNKKLLLYYLHNLMLQVFSLN